MLFNNEDIIMVTGASSGIGRALALELNKEGASVVGIARSYERLQETKNLSSCPERFFVEQKDLTKEVEALPEYVKSLKDKYGKFKGLACVAGIDNVCTIQMLNKKDIDDVFLINYTVPMLLTKGFADRRNNVGEGANILFIASIAGVYPDKGQIIYGASKAALIAATTAISKETALRKIRCNSISPAWVETEMFRKQKENIGASTEQYALGIGKPEDIANLGAFLMSDKARWITAANHILGGG